MEIKKKRLGCEKTINNDHFRLKIGTTNKKEPVVFYFEGKTFITMIEDGNNKVKISEVFRRKMIKLLKERLASQTNFDKNYIMDFQLAESGIKINKSTFLTFQILLKQKEYTLHSLKDIKANTEKFINSLILDFKDYVYKNGFVFSKQKKK